MPNNLSSLKSKVEKLDIGILETTVVDLNKLSDKVENDVVKKTEYAVHTTDTSNLVIKTDYDAEIGEIEKNTVDQKHDKYTTTQEFNKLTK